MNRLINFQIKNLFKQKFYYVCLFLFVFMYPVLDYISTLNIPELEVIKVMPQFINLLSGGGTIISIVFIVLFTCLDFNEGTTKNIIGRGYTRNQLLISKYITALIGVFSFYIISFFVILILFGKNGFGYENYMLYSSINSVIRIIAYTILYSTMSFILEKNTSSILACLFIPSIIQTIFSLIDSKMNIEISKYWIDNVSSSFIENPNTSNFIYSIIFYIIYIIIFIVLGTSLIKKKEIK